MVLKTAQKISDAYFNDPNTDLHSELAKIASEENLSAQMIERVATRANRNIIVGLQKTAVQQSKDEHFVFPTIKTAGVLEKLSEKKPSAKPRAPERPPVDMSKYFGTPDPDKNSRERELSPSYYENGYDGPENKDITGVVHQMRQHEASEAASKVAQLEFVLEDKIREFTKKASHMMLSGTPVEVFEALPIQDIVTPMINHLESIDTLNKLAHLEEDFELDQEHPMFKLARDIVSIQSNLEEAIDQYEDCKSRVDATRRKLREYSK